MGRGGGGWPLLCMIECELGDAPFLRGHLPTTVYYSRTKIYATERKKHRFHEQIFNVKTELPYVFIGRRICLSAGFYKLYSQWWFELFKFENVGVKKACAYTIANLNEAV